MGGGGLRILPHKKWHVWRRDNIERVLRDEREQEEKQQEQSAKERGLEQERRAQQLSTAVQHEQEQEHVNLFEAEEAQASRDNTRGRKRAQNGADDTLRRHGRLPWYAQGEDAAKKEPTVRQELKRKRELEMADPLQHMRPKAPRAVRTERGRRKVQEGPDGSDRRKYSARYDRLPGSPERSRCGHEDEERLTKRSKRHKEKRNGEQIGKKEALMQELRRERVEREATERRRAQRVMQGR